MVFCWFAFNAISNPLISHLNYIYLESELLAFCSCCVLSTIKFTKVIICSVIFGIGILKC